MSPPERDPPVSDPDVPPGFEDDVPPGEAVDTDPAASGQYGEPAASESEDDAEGPDLASKPPGLVEAEGEARVEVPDAVTPTTTLYDSGMTFEDLGLSEELLSGLYIEMKFEKPSRIQAETLPRVLAPPFRHLIAQGHNGCGKTTCFALAMLSRVDPGDSAPQALCMCPTRELVVQNLEVVRKMGKHTGIQAIGTNEITQARRLRAALREQIIVGTAGKLEELITSRKLPLNKMRILVFDEADEMMKVDGFQDSSMRMVGRIREVSSHVQLLLFSASFEEHIKDYCMKIVPGATKIFIPKEELSLDVIKQYQVEVNGDDEKNEVIQEYIFGNADKLGQTILFVARKDTAARLHESLNADGYKCLQIGSHMPKTERDRAAERFKNMETKILIATDVIARGFDVSTVTLVVNYDLPVDHRTGNPAYDTYQHRIGRSGRFGRKGAAFNFVDNSKRKGLPDADIMDSISRYFQREIPSIPAHDEGAFMAALTESGLA